jgi:hypothetical protein
MTKEKDMKEQLLRQLDKDSGDSSDADNNSAQKIFDNYKAQLKRMKWITIISWLVAILYWLAMFNLKAILSKEPYESLLTRQEFMLYKYIDVGLGVLVVIAVLLTILMYFKWKTLTMLQISSRLAGIEEQLKKISDKR